MKDSPSEPPIDDTQETTTAGLSRRVVVQGAAWSIPVIALAVATPLAAASGAAALSFTLPAYAGTACTEITNVQATLTNSSGAPDPGKPVTVTLSDGYTFADGSTTYTGTTDASGKVTLPAVRVPATGGAASFVAAAGALNASAPVSAPEVATASLYNRTTGAVTTFASVPAGSTAIGDTAFQAPNGDLYVQNTLVASGVTSVGVSSIGSTGSSYTPFVSSTGVASLYNRTTGAVTTFASVPAGSTAIGDTTFQAPNGDLYVQNTLVASGVTSVGVPSISEATGISYTPFVSSTGVASLYNRTTGAVTTFASVPAGSTAIGDTAFQAPNGDLYVQNTLVASGVMSVGVPSISAVTGISYTPFVSSTGVASLYNRTTGVVTTFASVPAGSTAIGDTTFQAPNGDLYVQNTLVASGVSSVGVPSIGSTGVSYTPYVVAPTCAW